MVKWVQKKVEECLEFVKKNNLEELVKKKEPEITSPRKKKNNQIDSAEKEDANTKPNLVYGADCIPFDHLAFLKSIMKFLLHTMQTSGATDRVRNLIETSLPECMKTIMENHRIFGAQIYALCILNVKFSD